MNELEDKPGQAANCSRGDGQPFAAHVAVPDGTPRRARQLHRGWGGLAVVGFICSILIPPLGLILSIAGWSQCGRRRLKGKGLAVAGIVISIILTILIGMLVGEFIDSRVSPIPVEGNITFETSIVEGR